MTFHILIMVLGHSCEQEKKIKILIFFENLKNFQIFKKINTKFSFFLLFTVMCYDHGEDIKSDFLTSGKPKKQKKVKIMHIAFLKWRSKMTKNCIFFDFFSQANSQNWHKRLQNANFFYVTTKNKKFGNFRIVLIPLPFS